MKSKTIVLVGLGLVLATPPLRGQERSYMATKDVVWNAVHEALSELQIAVTKEDTGKGEIQSDPAPNDSIYLHCELHVEHGRPRREGYYYMPKAKLEVSIRERSTSETFVRIKFTGKKLDVSEGGSVAHIVCKSTGRLEEALLEQVQSRIAAREKLRRGGRERL